MASFSIQSPSSTAFLGSTRLATDARGYEQLSLRSTCAPNQAQQAQKLSNRCRSRVGRVTALLNEVSASSPTVVSETEAEVAEKEVPLPDASSFSAFMTQVADLVELVDSRDIIELQLKQTDCEVTIRKKDALQPVATPFYMAPPSSPQVLHPQPPAAPAVTSPAPASSTPSKAPAAAKPSTPSHPPLKCPMAGTFYRSPAPGAPPFVKVGDKVQKGQVICIIEAMKLMNEIEADQSGTVVEILAEDAKPVSVDTPLFVIAP